MEDFNMTGEKLQFNNNFKAITMPVKKEPIKIGIGKIILFLVVAFFIGAVLVLDNKNDKLKKEIAEQDTLINHLKTVLTDDLKMHHKPSQK